MEGGDWYITFNSGITSVKRQDFVMILPLLLLSVFEKELN